MNGTFEKNIIAQISSTTDQFKKAVDLSIPYIYDNDFDNKLKRREVYHLKRE